MKRNKFKIAALCLTAMLACAGLRADAADDQENAMEDLRSMLGTMSAQLNDMKTADANSLKWGINTDIRYDYDPYKVTSTELAAGTKAHPFIGNDAVANHPANGQIGMYAKRVELEATGKISSWAEWNLQFEFAGLKLEDTGVDAKGLDLLPFVAVPGYEWEAKVGLYRQPFGIENQTGSSSIPFPERAMIDGGYTAGGPAAKLVYERVMGVQMITNHNFGPIGYKVQAAVANDTKDTDPGNGAFSGTYVASTVTGAVTVSAADSMGLKTDQDPSEFGRLGIDVNCIPGVKMTLGGSAIHDSQNTALLTATGSKEGWQDTYGFDGVLGVPMAWSTVQAEWVAQNTFAGVAAPSYFKKRAEGWYIQDTTKLLAFFNKDWTALELNARVEADVPDVNLAGKSAGWVATSEQAATIALKYLWAGKNYTSVNYTTYALNGDYNAIGGTSLLSIQQQFNY